MRPRYLAAALALACCAIRWRTWQGKPGWLEAYGRAYL